MEHAIKMDDLGVAPLGNLHFSFIVESTLGGFHQSPREPFMWGFPNHRDTPKSSKSLNNFTIETYGFDWGSPILGNLHIHIYILQLQLNTTID